MSCHFCLLRWASQIYTASSIPTSFSLLLFLHLQQVLDLRELFILTGGILGPCSALQTELKSLLKDIPMDEEGDENNIWFQLPLSGIDFSACRSCTPSYRALPADFPSVLCRCDSHAQPTF